MDTKRAREIADGWLVGRDGKRITRETSISEESLALELVDALDEIERLRALVREACETTKPSLLRDHITATHAAVYGPLEDRGEAADYERETIARVQRLAAILASVEGK